MVGVTKKCEYCGKLFTTKSTKTASWEKSCYECHTHRKRAIHIHRTQNKHNNLEMSLRDEMKNLTKKITDIDVLISAEVSNAMFNMTDNDIFEKLNESIDNRLHSLETKVQEKLTEQIAKMDEENEKFREKIQNQIMILNNKIVKIMKEMK